MTLAHKQAQSLIQNGEKSNQFTPLFLCSPLPFSRFSVENIKSQIHDNITHSAQNIHIFVIRPFVQR